MYFYPIFVIFRQSKHLRTSLLNKQTQWYWYTAMALYRGKSRLLKREFHPVVN